jgi:hypothetical protein
MLDGVFVFVSEQQWHDRWRNSDASLQATDVHKMLRECGLLPNTIQILLFSSNFTKKIIYYF